MVVENRWTRRGSRGWGKSGAEADELGSSSDFPRSSLPLKNTLGMFHERSESSISLEMRKSLNIISGSSIQIRIYPYRPSVRPKSVI